MIKYCKKYKIYIIIFAIIYIIFLVSAIVGGIYTFDTSYYTKDTCTIKMHNGICTLNSINNGHSSKISCDTKIEHTISGKYDCYYINGSLQLNKPYKLIYAIMFSIGIAFVSGMTLFSIIIIRLTGQLVDVMYEQDMVNWEYGEHDGEYEQEYEQKTYEPEEI
jgi:hypothetical protein